MLYRCCKRLYSCTAAANSRFLVGEQGNQQKAPPLCLRDQKIWRKRIVGGSSYIAFSLFLVLDKAYIDPSYGRSKEREKRPTSSCASFHLDFCRRKLLPPTNLFLFSSRASNSQSKRRTKEERRYESERDSSTHIQELMKRAPPIEIAAATYQTNGKRCVATLVSSWLENDRPGNKKCIGQPVSMTA